MPATPSRIGFIREEFRRVIASTPAVSNKYGNLARESDDPVETFFDNVADAQAVANERQALLSPDRRRFRCAVGSIDEVLALTYAGHLPLAQYVDTERGADTKAVVSEIVIDLQKQQAAIMVWG
jgi:hypothetical protein